ncbi:MAG TPA: phenylalanine 4-monooxygenase [Alphaproteobacteria bacterium]|nr:phenylalanine 4-monooxygenase [Alphaproteobacteria bacterium]
MVTSQTTGAAEPRADFTIDQDWESYTGQEHATWRTLFDRQARLLQGRATPEFLDGIHALEIAADGIPDFRRLNDMLGRATGWQVVAVPGLVPDGIFFEHLANRRFPSTCFIRRPEQMDYLQEPDVFHDVFGHVPLLVNPVFADYMEAYGKGGLKALGQNSLHYLARLYWYTVEFGLIRSPEGMRIYGAGILSSKGESVFSLDDAAPNRIAFDLVRVMRTNYRIDDYQETYFVIDSFDRLFEETAPDFTALYARLKGMEDLQPGDVLPEDRVLHRGTGRRR